MRDKKRITRSGVRRMIWREEHKKKLVSPQDAAKVVKTGDKVFYPVFAAHPKGTLNALFDRMNEVEGVQTSSMAMLSPVVDIFGKLGAVQGSEKHIMVHEWFLAHPVAREPGGWEGVIIRPITSESVAVY
jgi:hypothetical protein